MSNKSNEGTQHERSQRTTLESETHTENKDYSNQLWVSEQIGNSPLMIRGNDDQGYFITLGKYRITENMELGDLRYIIEKDPYTLIFHMALTLIDYHEEWKKHQTLEALDN